MKINLLPATPQTEKFNPNQNPTPNRPNYYAIKFASIKDRFEKSDETETVDAVKHDAQIAFGNRAVSKSVTPILPHSRPIFYGWGGNLTHGHMNFNQTINEVFMPENVSIYTKDKALALKSGYRSLREDEVFKPELLCGRTAYVIAPSYTHLDYAKRLSEIDGLKGIYIDKPLAINPKELAEVEGLRDAGIYAGDHYYFGNLAALRLMGVDMPFRNAVTIGLDKTAGKKFSQCINEATPYFKEDEIASIKTVMQELDGDMGLRGRDWYKNEMGGGILLDLQLHFHNLLSLMGLKLNRVTEARGLKMPTDPRDLEFVEKVGAVGKLDHFDKFDASSVGEAVNAKGFVNDTIPFELDTIRGVHSNTKTLDIKGKNGEMIRIYGTSSKKRVELWDENGNVIAHATTEGSPYSLLLQDVEARLADKSNPENKEFMTRLWDAQTSSLGQVFEVKRALGNGVN